MNLVVPELKNVLSDSDGYSAEVLSSAAEIQDLQEVVTRPPWRSDILVHPNFFLASVSHGWAPRVVAVHNARALQGVICAKERVLGGMRLGLMYADLTFGSHLLGTAREQQRAVLTALRSLLALPRTRGLRLRIRRKSPELAAVRELLTTTRLDLYVSRVKDHASLALPSTYEELLQTFGSTTRRNFRYYRRRFELAGHCYVDSLTLDELGSAASYLEPKCTISSRAHSVDRILKMAAAADRPLAVGLRSRDGQWLSVIGGVYRGESGIALMQLNNDRDFPRDSLALVMRACLLESLIQRGIKELTFWAGTAPPLSRYVAPLPTLGIYLDAPTYQWRFMRWTISKFGPWLPKQVRPDARWIAPF